MAVLLVLVSVLIVIQDIVGPVLCALLGLEPKLGLAMGSISLIEGHGTAASSGNSW